MNTVTQLALQFLLASVCIGVLSAAVQREKRAGALRLVFGVFLLLTLARLLLTADFSLPQTADHTLTSAKAADQLTQTYQTVTEQLLLGALREAGYPVKAVSVTIEQAEPDCYLCRTLTLTVSGQSAAQQQQLTDYTASLTGCRPLLQYEEDYG